MIQGKGRTAGVRSSVGERGWGEACDEGVALGGSTDNSALGTALKVECKVQYYVCVLVGICRRVLLIVLISLVRQEAGLSAESEVQRFEERCEILLWSGEVQCQCQAVFKTLPP